MTKRIPLGPFDLVSFTGPDAVRFLNGQLTQDVRTVTGQSRAAFSCVTDAKGRLQFRIVITAGDDGTIHAAVPPGHGHDLESRLTRYLIADDAEATMTPNAWEIHHFIGDPPEPPAGVLARSIDRFGEPGCDWWVPADIDITIPGNVETCRGDALETLRITRAIPAWGREITEGMLPPEARLESTDISYQKGCYIGQEVISRIKSAGKVNRQLTRFQIQSPSADLGALTDHTGREAGNLTSIAPAAEGAITRDALGFLKRTAHTESLRLGDFEVRVLG